MFVNTQLQGGQKDIPELVGSASITPQKTQLNLFKMAFFQGRNTRKFDLQLTVAKMTPYLKPEIDTWIPRLPSFGWYPCVIFRGVVKFPASYISLALSRIYPDDGDRGG